MSLQNIHLRVARPTDNLDGLLSFYRDGLGFDLLFRFQDHDGFSGLMLGHKGSGYHLEFTTKAGHLVGRAPTADNLLVFYISDESDYQLAIQRMQNHGFVSVDSFNPYWDKCGKTFEDPDGYRVVFAHMDVPV